MVKPSPPDRTNYSAALGKMIRDRRVSMGWGRVSLAEVVGMDFDTIVAIEKGRGTIDTLLAILAGLSARLDPVPLDMSLGAWLRRCRAERGLSESAVANQACLSRPTIRRLEQTGHGHVRSLCTLLGAYGIPVTIAVSTPQRKVPKYIIHHGDAREVLATLGEGVADVCVTDPPYGLARHSPRDIRAMLGEWLGENVVPTKHADSYMRVGWDQVVGPDTWRVILRSLKPGGHLATFASPRTADITTMSLRIAGAEIRDVIAIPRRPNMPRGQDAARMLARRLDALSPSSAATRQRYPGAGARGAPREGHVNNGDLPAALAAYHGVGLGLSPAHDVVILARKPCKGAMIDNLVTHGVGSLRTGLVDTRRHPANFVRAFADLPTVLKYKGQRITQETDLFLTPGKRNDHPSPKPISIIRYIIRLCAPPGAIVIDPYMGSGSTGIGAIIDDCRFIGIERDKNYCDIARARIDGWARAIELGEVT